MPNSSYFTERIQPIIVLLAACFVIHTFLKLICGQQSQLPILVTTFAFTNMISRTSTFRSLVLSTHKYLSTSSSAKFSTISPLSSSSSSSSDGSNTFRSLSHEDKLEVLSAVKSLKEYKRNSESVNERRKKLFKLLDSKQQNFAKDVGYVKKLNKIDSAIAENYKLLDHAADHAIAKYGITQSDFALLDQSTKKSTSSGSNYRVIEALAHYQRDWPPGHVSLELLPIFEYIASQLELLIIPEEKKDTVLVFPGSGLGRLAYEFSKGGYGAVYAIENSGLMNALVDYNFVAGKHKQADTYTVYPYIHTNSDFYTTESQFRTFKYSPVGEEKKPEALHNVNQNFLEFEIPDRDKYKNVVVVSVFFLDTAENLFAYLDKIEKLTKPENGKKHSSGVQRGYWINAGPLKYGSAAQVELNADELADVRDKLGWVTASSVYSVFDPLSLGNKTGVVSYLTDKESMWQGYYGLNLFTSSRKENKSYRDNEL